MLPKIFVFGRPGSGKSTIVSYVKQENKNKVPIFHGDDYRILCDMYLKDSGVRFEPADLSSPDLGFNIKNPMISPVWNIALRQLEQETRQRIITNEAEGRSELIILEFARRDHREALQQFSTEFLHNSLFLLVEASIPICIRRHHKREAESGKQFMRDKIITDYYGLDNFPFMKDYQPVSGQRVECIKNEDLTKEELYKKIDNFIGRIFL